MDDVNRDAAGRWPEIFEALGIEIGKAVPCPSCGGEDRFTFDDRTGTGDYICRGCGAGGGVGLVAKCKNTDFKTALHMVAGITGTKPTKQGQTMPKQDSGQKRKMLNDLWTSSVPLTGSDPVSVYLHSRKITLTPDNIRYCAECYDGETQAKHPAMIAKIHHAGNPVGLHRTFLSGDMESRKKMMPVVDPIIGGAVKLFTPGGGMFEAGVLGVAEGIETACSAAQLEFIATWAALSTALMVKFEPPEKYRKIVIFGDADARFAGQKAAYALAHRLSNNYVVTVRVPEKGDYNDVLMRG